MNNIEEFVNKFHLEEPDKFNILKQIPDNSVDLIVTSPPYNVDIKYDVCIDKKMWKDYWEWNREWLTECFRVLKDDGRICLNHYLALNADGEKILPIAEYYTIMKEIGYKYNSVALWTDTTISKLTAWGCYDDQTRVMTKNGLRYFKDLDIKRDLFITRNIYNNNLEYQKAFDYIVKDYDGVMYGIKNKNFDLKITPNHNVLINSKGVNKLIEIQNITNNLVIPQQNNGYDNKNDIEYFYLPKVDYGLRSKKIYRDDNDLKIKMDLWLKFLGIYLTDGSVYYNKKMRGYTVSIYQSKQNFLEEIKEMLKELPFNFKYKKQKFEFYTCSKRLAEYLNEFKSKNNRSIPEFINSLCRRQKEIFINWMFYGDGGWKNGEKLYYATVSKHIFDAILPIFTELGYTYSLYIQKSQPHYLNNVLIKSNFNLYRILLKKSKNYHIRKNKINRTQYNGKVYCVSVPNQTLLVERNGCFTWCGNSWISASAPHINTPYEMVLICYKNNWKKNNKGVSTIGKKEFISGVSGSWNFGTDKLRLTEATFPEALPHQCINLLSYKDDIILDPFSGSGTTCVVAQKLGRKWIGLDISQDYINVANRRMNEFLTESSLF